MRITLFFIRKLYAEVKITPTFYSCFLIPIARPANAVEIFYCELKKKALKPKKKSILT